MDTGAPLRRVQISAFGNTPDARGTRVTSTDDQGRYELRELVGRPLHHQRQPRPASCRCSTASAGRVERGTPVEVADGQVVDKVTIALPRGGVITGRISDDIGEPIAAVQVQAFRYGFMPGGRRPMPVPQGGGQTDDTGAFRLYGLPPGDYYVSARPSGIAADAATPGASPPATATRGSPRPTTRARRASPTPNASRSASGRRSPASASASRRRALSRISGRVIGWPSTRGMGFISATPDEGIDDGRDDAAGADPARGRLRDARRAAWTLRAARPAARPARRRGARRHDRP